MAGVRGLAVFHVDMPDKPTLDTGLELDVAGRRHTGRGMEGPEVACW